MRAARTLFIYRGMSLLTLLGIVCLANDSNIVLEFPRDASVGSFEIRNREGLVQSILEAKGRVSVPCGSSVQLTVGPDFTGRLGELPIMPATVHSAFVFEHISLSSLDLPGLSRQTKLVELVFRDCTTDDSFVDESCFGRLGSLQKVSLRNSEPLASFLQMIAPQINLRELSINSELLPPEVAQIICQYKNLRTLRLRVGAISADGRLVLDLPELRELEVHGKHVRLPWRQETPVLRDLSNIRAPLLRRLSLVRTGIDDQGFSSVTSFGEIRNINLDEMSLSESGLHHLASIEGLEIVVMGGAVSEATIRDLPSSLRSLTVWSLTSNCHAMAATNLPELRQLYFSHGEGLDDNALPALLSLRQLTYLHINKSKISDDGILALASQMPECEIHFTWPRREVELGKRSPSGMQWGIGINGYYPLLMAEDPSQWTSLSEKDLNLIRQWLRHHGRNKFDR